MIWLRNASVLLKKVIKKYIAIFSYNTIVLLIYILIHSMHKDISHIKNEKTFVMIKPDGVQRWLVGEIISRFENKWLILEDIRITQPKKDDVYKHYPSEDNEWITRLWHKSLETFTQANIDPEQHLGTWDPTEIGKKVLGFLVDYISSWKCVMMIRSGANVLETARKLVGWTIPANADIGTIRWDYSNDTAFIANIEGRPLQNLIHASENSLEAQNEIALRFGK